MQGNGLWRLGDGPAIRLVRSDSRRVLAIVLRVRSLDAAMRHLKDRRMLGQVSKTQAEINTEKTPGIRVLVEE